MRDLIRLLLETTPIVTLFVRTENDAAIALYESVGMRLVGSVPLAPFLNGAGDPRTARRERVQRSRAPER